MIKGNKGEWSEIYAFLKLLADGKLYAADSELRKIPTIYYLIIKILRNESGNHIEYRREKSVSIINSRTGETIGKFTVDEFLNAADKLFSRITTSKGSSFSAENTEEFLRKIRIKNIKSHSSKKSDITVVIEDTKNGAKPTLGFSIKSMIGRPSTLFNSSKHTNFIFEIKGDMNETILKKINSIDSNSKLLERINAIYSEGCELEYSRIEGETLNSNLEIIDSNLPEILGNMLIISYRENIKELEKCTDYLIDANPLKKKMGKDSFYKIKVKNFLRDAALGMTPAKEWKGNYDASGGYIIVKENGEILCYHIYNINEFQEYLMKNTRFETPSTERYRFGKIYKIDERYFIKLNLQVRFIR